MSFFVICCCCLFKNFAYFAFQPQQERGKMTIFNVCKLQFKIKCSSSEKFLFSSFKSFGFLCPLCVDCISIRKLFHELCSRSRWPLQAFSCGYLRQDFKGGCVFLISAKKYLYKERNSYYFKN